MDKQDMALNNLQWLIYHKTQPTNLARMSSVKNTRQTSTYKLATSRNLQQFKVVEDFGTEL